MSSHGMLRRGMNWEMAFLWKAREDDLMRWGRSSGPGEGVPYAFLFRYDATWSAVMDASWSREKDGAMVLYCTPSMKDISSMRHLV